MAYLANDLFRATLRTTFIDGVDTTLAVTAIPTNLPTIVTVGWGTDFQTVFSITGTSGTNSSNYALTGVVKLRGYSGNLAENLAVNCLNHEEFFNQYAGVILSAEDLKPLLYAADAGASDAYAIALDPVPTAYANLTGVPIVFKANTANTTGATLNINSLGAKTILKNNDVALDTGDIEAGQLVLVTYDGTNFQMQSQLAATGVTATSTDTLTNKTLTSPILQGLIDGWILSTDAYVYVSANSIKITGADRSTYFKKGTRIKLTQSTGGTKYFVCTADSTFSTDTTIPITAGSTYTLNNEAITLPHYSYEASPAGYPSSFAYTATWSCSGSMTISVGTVNYTRFSVVGNRCTWTFSYTAFTLGGTQSTDIYATLPISSSRTVANTANDANACQIVNGGVSSVGFVGIKDSDATKGLFRVSNSGSTNWTLGTTNGFLWGQLIYEI